MNKTCEGRPMTATSFLTMKQAEEYVNQDLDKDIDELKEHVKTLAEAEPLDTDVLRERDRSLRLPDELKNVLQKF